MVIPEKRNVYPDRSPGIAEQDFRVNTSYQFSLTKDEQFLETIMTVAFLLRLAHLRETEMDWTTKEGFVLEREKLSVKDCK